VRILIKKRVLLAAVLISILLILKPSIIITTKQFFCDMFSVPLRLMKNLKSSVSSKASYIRENFLLKEKAALLAIEITRNSEISKENTRLRELLDFQKKLPYKSVPAEVIGRVPSTWTRAVLINKGTKRGVKKGMAVCTASGLIGTVVEAGPITSKVRLLTDPNSRVGVVLEKSRQIGLLVGTREGLLKVIYLGIDSNVKLGEDVFTSGLGGAFPKGIAIGIVKKVGKDRINLYKYVMVKPNQDLNSLEEVLCIE